MHRPTAALAATLATLALAACDTTTTRTVTQLRTRTVAPPNRIPVWQKGGPQRILSDADQRALKAAGGYGDLPDDLDAFGHRWGRGDGFFAGCVLQRMKVPNNDTRIVYLLIALQQHDPAAETAYGGAAGWCVGVETMRDASRR